MRAAIFRCRSATSRAAFSAFLGQQQLAAASDRGLGRLCKALQQDGQHHLQADVIVSDVGMPEVDGFELMRRIRRRAATADIPAIALTAFTRQDDRAKALQAGFTDYLAKPVEPAALAAAIKRAVATAREA